jgi:hypothetical protein
MSSTRVRRIIEDKGAEPSPTTTTPRAGLGLARLIAREGEAWRVSVGGVERVAERDPSVDEALLDECLARGARVVVEEGAAVVIVGALATSRSLSVDARGDVRAAVGVFEVTARESVTLRTDRAFVQVKGPDVETFGRTVVTRARELAKVLGRMVKIN